MKRDNGFINEKFIEYNTCVIYGGGLLNTIILQYTCVIWGGGLLNLLSKYDNIHV